MTRGRGRALAINLALLLCTAGVSLVILEGAARLFARESGAKRSRARYLEYDPLLGWHKRPGADVSFREPEYEVDVRINSRGLRDPERNLEAAPGTTRILALGDSFVEGYTVPLEKTVSQSLEDRLRKAAHPVEVINGGTSAYSTDQEYLFYESEGVKYGPQVVVLFFYYNDIVYNALQSAAGTPKPILVLREGELQVHRFPVEKRESRKESSEVYRPFHSALASWVRDRLWYGAPGLHDSLGRLGLWDPRSRAGAPLELRVYEKKSAERVDAGWKSTALILDALSRRVAKRGGHLLVAYVPSRFELDDAAWRSNLYIYRLNEAGWDRRLVINRLQELGHAAGYPVLDLTKDLKAENYFRSDGHWNASGHDAAARSVGTFLQGAGWLQAPDAR